MSKLTAITILCTAALLACARSSAQNPAFAPDQMSTILYGASYYAEYMPYERLDKDVELMHQAGINVVRMGESSWGIWEPQDGNFEFAWMDHVIDRMHAAGISVILGTPTYSIPAWLYKEHPEIVITPLGGQPITYGMRQNADLANPTYRRYCERVIRKILEHYKDNPAVIGYQIDNETSAGNAGNPDVQAGFVEYLKKKFISVDELNRIWGLNYWGQRLNDWSEIPPQAGIINPGWKLEWARYQQQLTTDFLGWQAKIVREYMRPEQFVMQDFSGPPAPESNVNERDVSRTLDIVATNPYHSTQGRYDGQESTLRGDFARSLKQTNYLVTETNAQTTGWDSKGQFPPYDGQLRLDVYTHISSGANSILYWHWHSLHYGQETYWKGVLGHDLEPTRAYAEVSRIAHELQKIGPEIANFKLKNRVAILYSSDSYFGIEFMKFSDRTNYMTILQQMYSALYKNNVGIDFLFPDSADFSQYKVIVIPPLYVASDALLRKLADFVRDGGHVLMTFKSGFTNEYDTVRWEMAPGPLREATGFHYQEFSSLPSPIMLKDDPFQAGSDNHVSDWAEMLIPDTAKPVAYYDDSFLGKYPAVTRNQLGKGTLTYEGTVLTDKLQQKVVADVLKVAGLAGPDQQLPEPVRVKHGTGCNGKMLHYYLNYSGQPQSFKYPYGTGTDLLQSQEVRTGAKITLNPWDLVIVEENGKL